MSIVSSYQGSEKPAKEPVMIKQAQDLVKHLNEKLPFTFSSLEKKHIAVDRNKGRLWSLREEESRYEYQLNTMLPRCFFRAIHHKHDEQATIGGQDELIRNLRYKLLHKTNCVAEEKRLIKQIKKAEEIRETLVANPKPEIRRICFAKESNTAQVYQARLQKKKYEKMILEERDSARKKKLKSLQDIHIRINEKRSKVHNMICDLVKQQEQISEAHNAANVVSTTNNQLE